MKINSSFGLAAAVFSAAVAVFVCGCAGTAVQHDLLEAGPGGCVRDRTYEGNIRAVGGIYENGTMKVDVISTNASGQVRIDRTIARKRGFHLPFSGLIGGLVSGTTEVVDAVLTPVPPVIIAPGWGYSGGYYAPAYPPCYPPPAGGGYYGGYNGYPAVPAYPAGFSGDRRMERRFYRQTMNNYAGDGGWRH